MHQPQVPGLTWCFWQAPTGGRSDARTVFILNWEHHGFRVTFFATSLCFRNWLVYKGIYSAFLSQVRHWFVAVRWCAIRTWKSLSAKSLSSYRPNGICSCVEAGHCFYSAKLPSVQHWKTHENTNTDKATDSSRRHLMDSWDWIRWDVWNYIWKKHDAQYTVSLIFID